MKQLLLILIAALGLSAADATGRWTGTFAPDMKDPGPALLLLKQEGTALTGTVGPHAEEQHPIQNGKAENGSLTFEVNAGESIMKFTLKQEGEEIAGEAVRERDGQTQKARLAVKREKQGA